MKLKFIINTLLGITLVNARIIMLLRHGEKLDDTMVYLSEQGKARAECLTEKFGTVFFAPDKIYAQSPDDKKPSTRPRDTVSPLSKKLGLRINMTYNKGQAEELVKDIKNSPEEIILVSWSNDELNNIAKEFGIANSPAWDGKIFDQLWIITKTDAPYVVEGANVKPIAVYYGKDNSMKVVKQDVDDCIRERLKINNPSASDDKTTRIIKIIKTSQPSEGENAENNEENSSSYKLNTNFIFIASILYTIIAIFI